MDLLSLPDEMLASVFKHANYDTLTIIRKINRHIDRITVRYGANAPQISTLELLVPLTSLCLRYYIIGTDWRIWRIREINDFPPENKYDHPSLILENFLKRVRCRSIFLFCSKINAESLSMLSKIKNAKQYTVELSKCSFYISTSQLKAVFCKFGRIIITMDAGQDKTKFMGKECTSDEVVSSLLPLVNELQCDCRWPARQPCPEITDESLKMAIVYKPSVINFRRLACSFSVQHVLKIMKVVIEGGVNTFINWNLGYIRIISQNELALEVAKLQWFKGEHKKVKVIVEEENDGATLVCFTHSEPSSGGQHLIQFRLFFEENQD